MTKRQGISYVSLMLLGALLEFVRYGTEEQRSLVLEMKRIIGIDPGSRFTGWGIIEGTRSRFRHVAHGTIVVKDKEFHERLIEIHLQLEEIVKMYQPDIASIEKIFVSKNAQSALKLGQARGAAMVALLREKVPIEEYTPLEIKQAVTGYGKASKEQVTLMVQGMLRLQKPAQEDASDALAASLCHLLSVKFSPLYAALAGQASK